VASRLAAVVVALALLVPAAAGAQTVSPPVLLDPVIAPEPGTPTIAPDLRAAPPFNIAPVTAPTGLIAVVPASGDGAIAPVTTDIGSDARLTLLVPADPALPQIVRLQGLGSASIPPVAAAALATTGYAFTVELFDGTTGAPIRAFPRPFTAGVRLPAGTDPTVLAGVRFDEQTVTFEPLTLTTDPAANLVMFTATGAGYFLLGVAAQ
jgi:hypothetical protein